MSARANPYDDELAEAQARLQQVMALRDDHPCDPGWEAAVDQLAAELSNVAFLHAQAGARYVASVADNAFYGT